MALKCLIIDDELMARKALERLCEKRSELEIISICESAEEALTILNNQAIDLIFLDVEMSGISGLQLLDSLSYLPIVIMTTSKTDYAFDAFQYQVSDYLKKPITQPRFMQAIDKALEKHNASNQPLRADTNDIFIKEDGRYIRLAYDEILYVENLGDYAKVRTSKNNHVVYTTMKTLEDKLPQAKFFRVHRSFIVNLSKIVDIEDSNLVIADKVIPISRANKSDLMQRLNLL
jgi:DNA-binding LytR/AlgR family response regulator